MIKKLRETVAIAAVIVLFTTGSVVAQAWFQAANTQDQPPPLPDKGYVSAMGGGLRS